MKFALCVVVKIIRSLVAFPILSISLHFLHIFQFTVGNWFKHYSNLGLHLTKGSHSTKYKGKHFSVENVMVNLTKNKVRCIV